MIDNQNDINLHVVHTAHTPNVFIYKYIYYFYSFDVRSMNSCLHIHWILEFKYNIIMSDVLLCVVRGIININKFEVRLYHPPT